MIVGALQRSAGKITSVDLSDDGRRVVSGTDDGTVQVWNADTGQPVGAPIIEHAGAVTSVAFQH